MFFVNKPKSCVWVKGLKRTYLEPIHIFLYETTIVLMKYESKEDIQFKNAYNFSAQGFEEDFDELNSDYGRMLKMISKGVLLKNWKEVWFKWDNRFYADYTYKIYTCGNEILVIAESNHTL